MGFDDGPDSLPPGFVEPFPGEPEPGGQPLFAPDGIFQSDPLCFRVVAKSEFIQCPKSVDMIIHRKSTKVLTTPARATVVAVAIAEAASRSSGEEEVVPRGVVDRSRAGLISPFEGGKKAEPMDRATIPPARASVPSRAGEGPPATARAGDQRARTASRARTDRSTLPIGWDGAKVDSRASCAGLLDGVVQAIEEAVQWREAALRREGRARGSPSGPRSWRLPLERDSSSSRGAGWLGRAPAVPCAMATVASTSCDSTEATSVVVVSSVATIASDDSPSGCRLATWTTVDRSRRGCGDPPPPAEIPPPPVVPSSPRLNWRSVAASTPAVPA